MSRGRECEHAITGRVGPFVEGVTDQAATYPIVKQHRSARVILAGHALVQNIRRARYELAVEEPVTLRLVVAFDELALAI